MQSLARLSLVLLLAVCVASLAGCGKGSAKFTTTPPAPQYLYVANDDDPGGVIAQYTLPLTSTSTPNFSLSINNVDGVALDSSGNLIAIGGTSVEVYNAPLSATSAPAVTFNSPPAPIGIALDSSGDLFVGSNGSMGFYVSDHPLTSSSTFSTPNTNGLQFVNGAAVDPSGNLIVSNNDFSNNTGSLAVFAPPYTGAPAVVTPALSNTWYFGSAISGTQLFVPNHYGSSIDVYNLPLATSSAPVFSIPDTVVPGIVAFDKSGNMYVGSQQGEIDVFAPPFSATSAPTVTLNLTSGGNAWNIWGMTITR